MGGKIVIGSTLRAVLAGTAASLLIACFGEGVLETTGDPQPGTPPPPSANNPPSMSVASSFEVLVGRVLTISPAATDPDGDSLNFSVSRKPEWMSFSAKSGVLTGTPGAADVGVFHPEITVSDGKARTSDRATVQVVQSAAGRATLSWQAPSDNVDGSPLTDLAGFRVYYGNSPDNLRYVIQIAEPGARSHTIEDLTVGHWYFAATAFDQSGGESARSNVASKTIA